MPPSMRWGELVGLQREFVRADSVRVEWQHYPFPRSELQLLDHER